MPDEWKQTLRRLRGNFESLALHSKGMYCTMTEEVVSLKEPRRSGFPPHIEPNAPFNNPHAIFATHTLPCDYPRPRQLSEDEKASAPLKGEEDDRYVRDASGRAHAVWMPLVNRHAYIQGDHSVSPQFTAVAEAAGATLLTIPDEFIQGFAPDISALCRVNKVGGRRYVFGDVPPQPLPWMSQGWAAGGLAFQDGVVIDNPEVSESEGERMAHWLLLLHRLGWTASPGALLRASRWYWNGNSSFSYRPNYDQVPAPFDEAFEKVPKSRFYSVLGSGGSSQLDLCWASAWAIDEMIRICEVIPQSSAPRVVRKLAWSNLTDEMFERLLFNLVSRTPGYENPQWLTNTHAPDRGRDISVWRVSDDALGGTTRLRVIIACKHWQSRGVNLTEIATLKEQMKLWPSPKVDVLVIAASGTLTTDAVQLIEQHNQSDVALRIEMWPGTHLERLLAGHQDIVTEFKLDSSPEP